MNTLIGGRFVIEREAGAGAMARVYRARDITNNEIVALKILNPGTDTRRFAREVSVLADLQHPAIVRYIAHGTTSSGQGFLAMEWLDGESLEARLARGSLRVGEALELARSIAGALGAAHRRSIVHRDVKPANIFLTAGAPSQPKLLDFGLVRTLESTFALTNTGDLLGTPLYMAPEQARCDLAIDARVDVYALGAVIYGSITGRPPIVAPNIVGLLAKIVLEEPPRPSLIASEVPIVVDELLARMLAKSRDTRPADGDAAAAAIADAMAQLATSPRRAASSLAISEQRVVSILLATNAKLAGAALDATIGSFGGVLGLADGSTMIVFDGPETPGDLASRAARYALNLRGDGVAVALATGRAVLSGPAPVGEVIDRAAHQLNHGLGLVRIDRETAALIDGRFELAADEHGSTLVAERAGALDSVRTLLGKPTRCIGRDRELSVIEGYFAEVISESTARAVIVVAEAGIGKSRLALEVQRRLASHSEVPEVIVGRCESTSEHSPFAGVAAALRRAAGIASPDSPAQRAERLAALLERDGAATPEVNEFLGEILAIPNQEPSERVRAARENPLLMFDQLRSAWTTWLARACERRPVLLVIEDLHWADESSVLLVDAALVALAESRFMVLALARPEVRNRKPWAARRPHELRLDPLPRRASERLIRDALGGAATDSVVAEIIARADGNALFLEELIRATAHQDVTSLPVGVIGTLQLRFDSLRPETRVALRAASIFGERFTMPEVTALVPPHLAVGPALEQLVAEELIAQHVDGYAFRHALVREAAYALLPDDARRVGHALAADLMEADGTHDAAVIARHFELGQMFPAAARWYARAAEHALSHNDLTAALAHAQRAQSWTDEPGARGNLELIIAEVQFWRGDLAQACAAAVRAAALQPVASSSWFQAVGLIVTASGQQGDDATVAHWCERVLVLQPAPDVLSEFVLCLSRASSQLAWGEHHELGHAALARADAVAREALGPSAEARREFARAYDRMRDGIVDACVASLREVAEIYTRIGATRDALQMTMLGHAMGLYGGFIDAGLAALEQCIADAERMEARYLADWARWEVACAFLMKGELASADAQLALVSRAVNAQPLLRDVSTMLRAWAAFHNDDIGELEAIVASSSITHRRFRAALAGFAAYVNFRRGDAASACDQARAAIAVLVATPGVRGDGCLAGFVPALATLVGAGAPDAIAALEEHLARLESIAGKIVDPAYREALLHGAPWNRRVRELRDEVLAR